MVRKPSSEIASSGNEIELEEVRFLRTGGSERVFRGRYSCSERFAM